MKTIVVTARRADWQKAQAAGRYTQSTIESTLAEVGFIHASFPDQTLEIINRKYTTEDDLVLLLIDADKLTSPLKYEGARSGRTGTFPHIYGPLNNDAVYTVATLQKRRDGEFSAPDALKELEQERQTP